MKAYLGALAAALVSLGTTALAQDGPRFKPLSVGELDDEAAVYDFCTELNERKFVSDATYKAVLERFGERGVVDLIGVSGYYTLVSMVLNVDRHPAPENLLAGPPTQVMNIVREADIKFQPARYPGIQSAVISGSLTAPGQPYVQRNKFSPGTFSPPHFHPETRYIVVLKG